MFFNKKKPKDDFFDLFKEAADNLVVAADYLEKIVTVPSEERKQLCKELHQIENNSDALTHRIHSLLNATFVTPLDRDDISTIAKNLDDCMDYMDEAGDMILLYDVQKIPKQLTNQVAVLSQCANLTANAMNNLRKNKNITEYVVEINRLENVGDKAYRKMLVKLFDSKRDPITIIKIKDIIDSLERGVDSFEHLANVVETIFIKES